MGATDRSFARSGRARSPGAFAHRTIGPVVSIVRKAGGGIKSIFSRAPSDPTAAREASSSHPRPRPRIAREKRLRRLSGRSARVPRARDRARAVPRRPEVRAARASRLARTSDRPARRWRASRRPRTTGRRRMVRRRRRMRKPVRGRGLPLLPRTSQPRDGAEGAAGEALRGGGCRALREARGLGGSGLSSWNTAGTFEERTHTKCVCVRVAELLKGKARVGSDADRVNRREVVRGRRDRGDGPR